MSGSKPPPVAGVVSGWGGISTPAVEHQGEDLARLTEHVPLTRGLGRAYGDSALPPPGTPIVAGSVLADRILAFDETTGVLHAEAGLSLDQLYRTFLPRGWFTPVSPGTRFVTLGGMVAADVHGKNHHVDGSIGRHVRRLTVRTGKGAIVTCSREVEPELFRATIGGMGLTGHILDVELTLVRVPSPWILGVRRRIGNVGEFVDALKQHASAWPFTMGWVDCLSRGRHMGRGLLMAGRWAAPDEAPRRAPRPLPRVTVPFTCPDWVMGHTVGRLANGLIYRLLPTYERPKVLHPEPFFYPLDVLRAWNRLYGRRGFTQHQCVLPESAGPDAVRDLMELLTRQDAASFLCVIKDCGEEGEGILSFPRRGVSIALDMPIRENTQEVVDTLNAFVVAAGGRVYLAKDAFTRADHFRAMEPRLGTFQAIRRRWDPDGRIRSAQSVRLFGDRP